MLQVWCLRLGHHSLNHLASRNSSKSQELQPPLIQAEPSFRVCFAPWGEDAAGWADMQDLLPPSVLTIRLLVVPTPKRCFQSPFRIQRFLRPAGGWKLRMRLARRASQQFWSCWTICIAIDQEKPRRQTSNLWDLAVNNGRLSGG